MLEPGGGGGQCLSYRSLLERREGLEAFLKEEVQEDDKKENKEDDDDE